MIRILINSLYSCRCTRQSWWEGEELLQEVHTTQYEGRVEGWTIQTDQTGTSFVAMCRFMNVEDVTCWIYFDIFTNLIISGLDYVYQLDCQSEFSWGLFSSLELKGQVVMFFEKLLLVCKLSDFPQLRFLITWITGPFSNKL